MSEALDAVRNERADGRLSPAVATALSELDARVSLLERPESDAKPAPAKSSNGGK